jgi:predicted transcriptional regulator
MTIELSPEIEARLKAKADAEGVSITAYLERLVFEEEARSIRLAAFEQAISERLRSLSGGESVDGEEVMARLVAELDEPRQIRSTR